MRKLETNPLPIHKIVVQSCATLAPLLLAMMRKIFGTSMNLRTRN
jgi:hypothetical protein